MTNLQENYFPMIYNAMADGPTQIRKLKDKKVWPRPHLAVRQTSCALAESAGKP